MDERSLAATIAKAFDEGEVREFALAPAEVRRELGSEAGKCHDNATRYCQRHGGARVFEGWIKNANSFARHSVVELDNGELLDVTMPGYAWKFLIVRHAQVCSAAFTSLPPVLHWLPEE